MNMELIYIDTDITREITITFDLEEQRSIEDAPLWQKMTELCEAGYPFKLTGTTEDIRSFLIDDLELRKECANDTMVWGSGERKTTEYWYQFRNGILKSLQGWEKLYDARLRWFRDEKADIERMIDRLENNG
jgi:hypothetical protein